MELTAKQKLFLVAMVKETTEWEFKPYPDIAKSIGISAADAEEISNFFYTSEEKLVEFGQHPLVRLTTKGRQTARLIEETASHPPSLNDLTERQNRFLLAAYAAAPELFRGSERQTFNYREIGKKAGFSESESDDLGDVLNAGGYMQEWEAPYIDILTAKGRELARELKEARRSPSLNEVVRQMRSRK